MNRWAALSFAVVAMGMSVVGSGFTQENPAESCAVPSYLLFGDSTLDHVRQSVVNRKRLAVLALGGTSSSLPGRDGTSFAYPARLEAALKRRLPDVEIVMTVETRVRQSAAQMTGDLDKLLSERKPDLVIWQTGTYDAVQGFDAEEFRSAVSDAVVKMKDSGADVVLVNMQYSPRTEAIVPGNVYADALRWVSREREAPVFDRQAIMRHWHEQGEFDLGKATKDMKLAKGVHDCLGRALAATIIDAAGLSAREGIPQQ